MSIRNLFIISAIILLLLFSFFLIFLNKKSCQVDVSSDLSYMDISVSNKTNLHRFINETVPCYNRILLIPGIRDNKKNKVSSIKINFTENELTTRGTSLYEMQTDRNRVTNFGYSVFPENDQLNIYIKITKKSSDKYGFEKLSAYLINQALEKFRDGDAKKFMSLNLDSVNAESTGLEYEVL